MRYRGMKLTWEGIISEAMNTMNSRSFPLNLSLAKANAAALALSSPTDTESTATNKELKLELRKPLSWNSLLYDSNVGFFGIHSIGRARRAPLLLKEVDIIQRNGTKAMMLIAVPIK
jgi:hypothetical protein